MGSQGMRVLVLGINYAPEPTGIAPYSSRMAAGLNDRGHLVEVITANPHYPQWRVAKGYSGWTRSDEVDGVPLTRVKHYVPATPTGLHRAASELSFGLRSTGRPWGRPDVIICVSPALLSTGVAMLRVKRGRSGPALGLVMQDLYSAGIAETGGGSAGVGRVLSAIEGRVARRADGVVVIHDRFRRRVVDRLGVDPERVTVVRNWTHVASGSAFDRQAMRRSLGWHDDETVVLHSGAMGEKQELGNVVAAARSSDRNIRFVLMGDGGQRRSLEEAGAGIPNLQFLDPLPGDAYGMALRSADVLLVNERPGVAEMAVPSKLTSYFSTGLPVLAATSSHSTTAEELNASGAGVVVVPGDPAALAEAASELGLDPVRARALGARGPEYCARVLSEEAALDKYDQWVRHLHETKTRREGQR